jgi:membrane associated rhomboid family serine protease
MFIPIGTDNPLKRRPLVNYALVILNFVIFFFTLPFVTGRAQPEQIENFRQLMLIPSEPHLYQFITYAFLHGGWMHVIGNMLFLYIFGNNVNDKLGNVGYLLFYLGGAICSGLGHVFLSGNPVLGASGAVAAVTGAYMVLFPKTYVHILYIIFFIGTTEIPAFYFILLKLIIFDNIISPKWYGAGNIAYSAHLAGYSFGILIPMGMLAFKILPHSHYDLWAVVQRYRRRKQYDRMVNQGFDPFGGSPAGRRWVNAEVKNEKPAHPQEQQIMTLRAQISEAVGQSDIPAAAEFYLQLMEIDDKQILPQQQQLDIANKLMHTGRHRQAAHAYEVFIEHYPQYHFLEQVQLMLGLLYSRYLNQGTAAKKHLEAAMQKLSDSAQRKMCQEELDRL